MQLRGGCAGKGLLPLGEMGVDTGGKDATHVQRKETACFVGRLPPTHSVMRAPLPLALFAWKGTSLVPALREPPLMRTLLQRSTSSWVAASSNSRLPSKMTYFSGGGDTSRTTWRQVGCPGQCQGTCTCLQHPRKALCSGHADL